MYQELHILFQLGHVCDKRLKSIETSFKKGVKARVSPWTLGHKGSEVERKGMKPGNGKLLALADSHAAMCFSTNL